MNETIKRRWFSPLDGRSMYGPEGLMDISRAASAAPGKRD